MSTAAIYTRISSDPSGERAGVTRQRQECEALAAQRGLTVLDTRYDDNDTSAFSGKPRKHFDQLLKDAKAGLFDTLIVWGADRLYRSLRDYSRVADVVQAHDIRILTVTAGDLDLATPGGELNAGVLASIARFESRNRSARVKARAKQRAEDGVMTASRLPFGWLWSDPDPDNPSKPRRGSRAGLIVNPTTAPLLADAYRDVAEGRSVAAAYRRLAAKTDVGRMTPSTLSYILKHPRNGGLVAHNGRVVAEAADGQRVVDAALWKQVHDILARPERRTSPGRTANTLLGGGLLRCGVCGGPMAASRKAGAPVYVCSGTFADPATGQVRRPQCMYRRRGILDPLATERVAEVLSFLADARLLVAADDDADSVEASLRASIAKQEAKIEALDDALDADEIYEVDYSRMTKRLRKRVTELEAQREKVARRPQLACLAAGDNAADDWRHAALEDNAVARAILAELLDKIVATPDRTLEYHWKGWLIGRPEAEVLPTVEVLPAYTHRVKKDELTDALGAPVAEVIVGLREQGMSWRRIARTLTDQTGISLTHTACAKYAKAA